MKFYCLPSRGVEIMQCSTKNANTNLERNIAKRARFQGCNLYGLRPANVKQMIERSLCFQVSCFVKDRNWSDETDSRGFWIPGDILSEDLKGTTPAIGDERKLKEARRWRATGCGLDESRRLQNHVRSEMDSSDKPEKELEWKEKSVSTASDALAEWRSARTRSGQAIVDWGRYHLQVMFVDNSHRVRARLAEGLFDRIAAWNGVGLILYGHSCGISAKEGELPSFQYQNEGHRLGIGVHVFKAPATCLDRSDLDSYDLIVAVDIEVRDAVLLIAARQCIGTPTDYTNKVRLMSEFVSYGDVSMLEDNLLKIVQPSLPDAQTALEVQRTYMSRYIAWQAMVATITMCCAGIVRFLMDAYPSDLPDYDPVD